MHTGLSRRKGNVYLGPLENVGKGRFWKERSLGGDQKQIGWFVPGMYTIGSRVRSLPIIPTKKSLV
jgi:hypothetical protein